MPISKFDGGTSSASSSSAGVLDAYAVNDVDDTGSGTTYVGKAKLDGTWLIERLVESGVDIAKTYANFSNNGSVSPNTYTQAWSDRLTLSYDRIQTLTDV